MELGHTGVSTRHSEKTSQNTQVIQLRPHEGYAVGVGLLYKEKQCEDAHVSVRPGFSEKRMLAPGFKDDYVDK